VHRLRSVLHGVDILSEWSGKTVSFLVLFMMVFLVCDIILRAAYTISIIWVHETVQFMCGGGCILAGAYVLRHRQHVNMDIFYQRLTPRKRAYLDLITSAFFFLFCGMLLWLGWDMFLRALLLGEHTRSSWAPILWPFKMAIPVGAFLILLQGLANFIRDIFTATGRELK